MSNTTTYLSVVCDPVGTVLHVSDQPVVDTVDAWLTDRGAYAVNYFTDDGIVVGAELRDPIFGVLEFQVTRTPIEPVPGPALTVTVDQPTPVLLALEAGIAANLNLAQDAFDANGPTVGVQGYLDAVEAVLDTHARLRGAIGEPEPAHVRRLRDRLANLRYDVENEAAAQRIEEGRRAAADR